MARLVKIQETNAFTFESRFANREAVLDADFETIAVAPKSSKVTNANRPTPKNEKTEDAMAVADKIGLSVFSKKPVKQQPDDSIAFYGFGACLVALSFWVSGGHSLFGNVDIMPTASIENINGSSEIVDAAWRVVTAGGKSALHVEGIVRNSGKSPGHTKPVTVIVKHSDGSIKRYLLGQNGWTLGPGQEVVVSGRLDIASANIATVLIALTD